MDKKEEKIIDCYKNLSSECKKIIRELFDNEKKYKVLTETSPDCIKLFDKNGKLIFISQGGLKEHRLKNAEDAGKWPYIESVVEQDRPKFKEALKKAILGEISTIEIRHLPAGSIREVCLETIAPVRNGDNEIIGIFGVSRDITELKRAEEELTKLNKLMVGRELQMIELKKETNGLLRELGRPEKYKA